MPEITEKEIPPNIKQLWLKALSAVQQTQLPYGVSLLQTLLKESPGFLEGRKLLRKCELQLTGNTKKKGSWLGGGIGMMKLQSQAKKDPEGTLPLVEKELENDPYNEHANELLFDICVKLELFETAAFALETVRKGNPENAKLAHKLAEFYISREQPDGAAEVYNGILKYFPTDGVANKGAKDASARASMLKQKWDENADMRTLMRNSAETDELEKGSRTGLTREQLEERRDKVIEKYTLDPNSLGTAKELASIYEQLEDWHNASAFYDWAHTLSKGDVALATKSSAMNDRAEQVDMKNLELAAQADPDNAELQAALEVRKADLLAEHVQEAHKRVEFNPTDPQLRYELGTALYESGDYSSAIPHLQQATRNPYIRTRVLLLLGRTFRAKGMFDLSIKQLTDALADLMTMDNTKKEILYEKGLIHMEMDDLTSALECFKQIYEVDYSYRDVANRVESSYS